MKQILIQMAVVAVVTFITGCSTLPCSRTSGWTQWKKSDGGNGHYYKAVAVTNFISWAEADKLAHAQYGYLATLTSKEENAFVFKLVDNPKFFRSGDGAGPALGGFQQDGAKEPDGGWSWVSGDAWDYSNWWTEQPNNWPGSGINEDRIQFYSGISCKPGATWNDVNRRDRSMLGYVIERDK